MLQNFIIYLPALLYQNVTKPFACCEFKSISAGTKYFSQPFSSEDVTTVLAELFKCSTHLNHLFLANDYNIY